MDLKHSLTVPEADRLRALCNFSDEEQAVFDLLIRDKTEVQISVELSMSLGTVKRRKRRVRDKVEKVSQK